MHVYRQHFVHTSLIAHVFECYNVGMKKKESATIEASLEQMNKALWRHSSLWYVFIHGVVRGVGTALGATVIVAVITSLAIHFFGSAHADAVIKTLIE